jgi:tRNA(Ile)-lysidine synthase TilS/MesJ
MPRRISSILRRHFKADRLLFSDLIIMRACSFYRIYNFLCVIAPESSYCERYFRSHLKCELAPLDAKVERLFKKKERLISEIAATYAKITRFRKQYRAVIKKLRDLGNRKDRNILELKIDEMMISNLPKILQKGIILLKALNSLSPRSFSFFNPALLGFSDRNVKVLQGSS